MQESYIYYTHMKANTHLATQTTDRGSYAIKEVGAVELFQ